MNHHYPDSYHGYGRSASGMPGMAYGGGYRDPTAMTRMGHPRESYPVAQYPVMQQSGGMYNQGNYMAQQGGNPYNMSGYNNFGMMGMNQSMMMNARQNEMNRSGGGNNMMHPYYNPNMSSEHPHSSIPTQQQPHNYSHSQTSPHMPSQQPHMGMMGGQSNQAISGQASMGSVSGQTQGQSPMGSQLSHSPGHHMSQVGPNQSGQAYNGQNSPHVLSRPHHVPQHPMRHPTTQQNPQEVADNILQMASAYPSNQTVQVPLKSRPAPYHIPRSPHYSVPHNDLPHTSPNSHPHQQPQQSPVTCQATPSPSSSSVKSPTPVLAPIPNPIPSPGISGLRSPCNQGMSPCHTQRSPAHMGSTYSGHGQGAPPSHCSNESSSVHHGMSPSDAQHYSPCSMTPTQNFPQYSASPSTQRNTTMYSPTMDPSTIPNIDQLHQSSYSSPTSSSPCSSNLSSYTNTVKYNSGHMSNSQSTASSAQNAGNNPLMSLQKLVMLPETQVVDPKSVVNDACLSSQQDEGPKNVDGPAERLAEGSSYSVGCQGQFSSHEYQPENGRGSVSQQSERPNMVACETSLAVNSFSQEFSPTVSSDSRNQECVTAGDNHNTNTGESERLCQLENWSSEVNQTDIIDKKVSANELLTVAEDCVQNLSTAENVEKSTHSELGEEREKTSHNAAESGPAVHTDVSPTTEMIPADKSTSDKDVISSTLSNPPLGDSDGLSDSKLPLTEESDKITNAAENCSKLSPGRKNGKVKEDSKRLAQCCSPNVLSEVPVVTNGLASTTCGNDDDMEQDCGNGVHTKLQNAFSSFVKTKYACAKRTSQLACVTPCSIAVGADERAACERFAFRRNGFCRPLRTSGVICNGRNRNDSTGNGDSDESLENVSDRSFGLSESPQDGNRKRTSSAARRNEHKKPNLNSVSGSDKVTKDDSKLTKAMASSSNGCESYNNDEGSDEEVCYYEGVDSSDIFVNNCSSDESVTSHGEVKQSLALKATVDKNGKPLATAPLPSLCQTEPTKEKDGSSEMQNADTSSSPSVLTDKQTPNCTPPSPPTKRLRRSSGQKAQEKLKALSLSKKPSNNGEKLDGVIDLTSDTAQESTSGCLVKTESGVSVTQNNSCRDQGRRSSRFRPTILSHRSAAKYPVVVLEKSPVAAGHSANVKEEKLDTIDLTASSAPARGVTANTSGFGKGGVAVVNDDSGMEHKVKVESVDSDTKDKSNTPNKFGSNVQLHSWEASDIKPNISTSSPKNKPKKKPHRKKNLKNKNNRISPKVNRNSEVKDSFKSMKFSRTLDMMKANRKRESNSVGPFIRLTGKRSAPDSTAVFNQPIPDALTLSGSGKHSKNKKSHLQIAATTVHMVTNLPTDKTAMASSTRTISHNPWVCAFCGHHSSFRCLGDLFGPYFKETELERVDRIAQEESKKGDSAKDQTLSTDVASSSKKGKEVTSQEKKSSRSRLTGRSKASSSNSRLPEEVWVHEVCAMWSPGVYLVGSKMYGLDEAVKDAEENICSACRSKGAMTGCLHKGCSMKYHVICAMDKGCYMDEENLSMLCPKHKDKRVASSSSAKS